jgi:hypothetical protein
VKRARAPLVMFPDVFTNASPCPECRTDYDRSPFRLSRCFSMTAEVPREEPGMAGKEGSCGDQGFQSAVKMLNSRGEVELRVELKMSWLPSRENMGKLSNRAP